MSQFARRPLRKRGGMGQEDPNKLAMSRMPTNGPQPMPLPNAGNMGSMPPPAMGLPQPNMPPPNMGRIPLGSNAGNVPMGNVPMGRQPLRAGPQPMPLPGMKPMGPQPMPMQGMGQLPVKKPVKLKPPMLTF